MHVHRAPNVCRWVYLLYSLDVWVHKQSLLSFTHLPLFVGFYIWRFNLYNKKVFLAIIILSILYFFFFFLLKISIFIYSSNWQSPLIHVILQVLISFIFLLKYLNALFSS
jgi:hypothetical protein